MLVLDVLTLQVLEIRWLKLFIFLINLCLFDFFPIFKDENHEDTWMLIPENDLVALFLQFPFDRLFKVIGTPGYEGNIYNV